MAEDKSSPGHLDPALIQNFLKLSGAAGGKDNADSAANLSRMTPDDRARALDLAASLIRQARKEATGTGSALPEEAGEDGQPRPAARPTPRPARAETGEDREKVREILFRGTVYKFKKAAPATGADRRIGVIDAWETEIEVEDGDPFTLMVEEFVDGRFSPWAFEGVFFKDFVQAAIVGVVAGTFQAKWMRMQWQHHRDHRRLLLVVMPMVAAFALLFGLALGIKVG